MIFSLKGKKNIQHFKQHLKNKCVISISQEFVKKEIMFLVQFRCCFCEFGVAVEK